MLRAIVVGKMNVAGRVRKKWRLIAIENDSRECDHCEDLVQYLRFVNIRTVNQEYDGEKQERSGIHEQMYGTSLKSRHPFIIQLSCFGMKNTRSNISWTTFESEHLRCGVTVRLSTRVQLTESKKFWYCLRTRSWLVSEYVKNITSQVDERNRCCYPLKHL